MCVHDGDFWLLDEYESPLAVALASRPHGCREEAFQPRPSETTTAILRILLASGADPNVRDPDGKTSISCALAVSSPLPVIQMLLDAGSRLNDLHCKDEWLALSMAISYCDLDVVRLLVDAGADVHAPACGRYFGLAAIQAAAMLGEIEIFRFSRTFHPHVNAEPFSKGGTTALQAAAINGHFNIVKILLGDGARVNAPGAEEDGRHAIEGEAEHGRLDTVVLLLDNDDDPETFRRRCLQAAKRARKEKHVVIAEILGKRVADHEWREERSC